MARVTDHDRRDAEAALAAEIGLLIGHYRRRLYQSGKERIGETFDRLLKQGEDINGTAVGRAVAREVAAPYFGHLLAESVNTSAGSADTGDSADPTDSEAFPGTANSPDGTD